MGRAQAADVWDRLILDAGALIALARGDARALSFLEAVLDSDSELQVPTPVVAQVHRPGHDHARMDRVLIAIDRFVPTTIDVARRAGELLGRSGRSDAIDAIVAAEALSRTPAAIWTSDPAAMTALVEAGGGAGLVKIVAI
jgi:predicted nucleic acid-binding protein